MGLRIRLYGLRNEKLHALWVTYGHNLRFYGLLSRYFDSAYGREPWIVSSSLWCLWPALRGQALLVPKPLLASLQE